MVEVISITTYAQSNRHVPLFPLYVPSPPCLHVVLCSFFISFTPPSPPSPLYCALLNEEGCDPPFLNWISISFEPECLWIDLCESMIITMIPLSNVCSSQVWSLPTAVFPIWSKCGDCCPRVGKDFSGNGICYFCNLDVYGYFWPWCYNMGINRELNFHFLFCFGFGSLSYLMIIQESHHSEPRSLYIIWWYYTCLLPESVPLVYSTNQQPACLFVMYTSSPRCEEFETVAACRGLALLPFAPPHLFLQKQTLLSWETLYGKFREEKKVSESSCTLGHIHPSSLTYGSAVRLGRAVRSYIVGLTVRFLWTHIKGKQISSSWDEELF